MTDQPEIVQVFLDWLRDASPQQVTAAMQLVCDVVLVKSEYAPMGGEPVPAWATPVDHVWMGRIIRHNVSRESEARVVGAVAFPWPVPDTVDYRVVVRLRVAPLWQSTGLRWVNPEDYHLVDEVPPVKEVP